MFTIICFKLKTIKCGENFIAGGLINVYFVDKIILINIYTIFWKNSSYLSI